MALPGFWQDEGVWVALGISALFLLVAVAMHRVIVKVLKSGAPVRQEQTDE